MVLFGRLDVDRPARRSPILALEHIGAAIPVSSAGSIEARHETHRSDRERQPKVEHPRPRQWLGSPSATTRADVHLLDPRFVWAAKLQRALVHP